MHAKHCLALRHARECRRNSWQTSNPRERREFLRMSREAMADARYWRDQ